MHLDITTSKYHYTQRNEYSKIIETNLLTNEIKSYNSLSEIPKDNYSELVDKMKIEINANKLFTYNKLTDNSIEITNFDYRNADITHLSIPSHIDGFEVVKISLYIKETKLKKIIIPDTVKSLSNSKLFFNKELEEVVLSKNIKMIPPECFMVCEKLKKINLENILIISASAFQRCESLAHIQLSSLEKAKICAFAECKKLKKINAPKLKYIEESTFLDCEELTTVRLNPELVCMGRQAFRNCYKLNDIVLPDTLRRIEPYTFDNCIALEKINMPRDLEVICTESFFNCGLKGKIKFPEGLLRIEDRAFFNCKFDKIKMSKKTEVKESAFESISKTEIPER